ncbi:MAG: BlaI/MecI/CopY family transcriptional regulator [Acidimicrobiia bacterium]
MKQQAARLHTGELETAVMNALWDLGGWRTPREVQAALSVRRPLAYTTIATILVRLWRKGRLDRQPDGRGFLYRPLRTRVEQAASCMEEALVGVPDRSAAFACFVRNLDRADRAKLRRALQRVVDT